MAPDREGHGGLARLYDRNGHRPWNDYDHGYQGHRSRYHSYQSRDPSVDQIGDYVARRLVPQLQRRSAHPVKLVMNFGTLYIEDAVRQGGGLSDAVIYNAPGCTMIVGSHSEMPSSQKYTCACNLHPLDVTGNICGLRGTAYPNVSFARKRCPRCGVWAVTTGAIGVVCRDCELESVTRAARRGMWRERQGMGSLLYTERKPITYNQVTRY